MQIDDATRVVTQECSRDDLPKVCEERPLCVDCLNSCDLGCVTNFGDVFHAQSRSGGPGIDRGWQEGTTPTGGTGRRSHDGEDGESRVCSDGAERRDREPTTAKQDQATTCDYALAAPYAAVQPLQLQVNHLAPRRRHHRRRSADP